MAKFRFRLRISRVIPSFNCRSKQDSTTTAATPATPTPSHSHSHSHSIPPFHTATSRNLSPFHHHTIPLPASSSGGEADAEADDIPLARRFRTSYLWTKSHKWHIVCCATSRTHAHAHNSPSPSSSPPRSKIDSHLLAWRHPRCSRELSDSSGDDSGWFSTDEEYAYEDNNDINCKSFSTDTMERNCFAVSKVSADPRGDFRQSMAEMVAERGIYDVEGLRRLLHCFLSLNDGRHRQAILAAFADVWYAIFPSVALAATFPNMFYNS